jgi:NADPH:quinone reductase
MVALLIQLLADGRIRPVIARRLPLTEVQAAHEMLEFQGSQGKIVMLPWATRARSGSA